MHLVGRGVYWRLDAKKRTCIQMDSSEISPKAYRIFYTELHKHIAEFEQMRGASEQMPIEMLRTAAMRFHTIKGGSGFFGLDQIAGVSSQLEKILKDREELLSESEQDEVNELFSQLKQSVEALDPPQEE